MMPPLNDARRRPDRPTHAQAKSAEAVRAPILKARSSSRLSFRRGQSGTDSDDDETFQDLTGKRRFESLYLLDKKVRACMGYDTLYGIGYARIWVLCGTWVLTEQRLGSHPINPGAPRLGICV